MTSSKYLAISHSKDLSNPKEISDIVSGFEFSRESKTILLRFASSESSNRLKDALYDLYHNDASFLIYGEEGNVTGQEKLVYQVIGAPSYDAKVRQIASLLLDVRGEVKSMIFD